MRNGGKLYTKYNPFLYSVYIINSFTPKNDIASRFDVCLDNLFFEYPRFSHKSISKNLYIFISCIEMAINSSRSTFDHFLLYSILPYITQQDLIFLFEKSNK